MKRCPLAKRTYTSCWNSWGPDAGGPEAKQRGNAPVRGAGAVQGRPPRKGRGACAAASRPDKSPLAAVHKCQKKRCSTALLMNFRRRRKERPHGSHQACHGGRFYFLHLNCSAKPHCIAGGACCSTDFFSRLPAAGGYLLHRAAPAFGRNLPAAFRFSKLQSSLLSKNWMLPYMQIIHSAGLLPCAAPAKTEGYRRLCCMLRWNSRAKACSPAPCPGESLWGISIFVKQQAKCPHAGMRACPTAYCSRYTRAVSVK